MASELAQLVAGLSAPDSQKRVRAAEQLARLGPDARPAAVNLVKAAGDVCEEVREYIAAALEGIGPPRLEDSFLLPGLLSSPSPDVGYWTATLLGRLKADAASAVPGLSDALRGSTALSVRERAAWALGQIGPPAATALDLLRDVASQGDPQLTRLVRLAREAIRQIGG
ncbi:MAG: HEAT repeat domain-containing protein [Pirellulales bacterium]|nr:HEAT repeat domain-containing protein [Pirellulales bacterium]